ncbi:hypothetical protein GLUCOINTEAF2_0203787 [Komagataeibacter intermedius AF2]|uniref:Uncharacterized protein n=1 Tax=Komagataeibacter intermedius AF2 TaxID=1458464 RepID=A0A0C1VIE0_9PROT|nr:hypothetical protein GLUCOINTEAF2_0203833 [Komagataeibacter intermedius AF2]KPH88516.1 hypothetical protein GLUCOINTEAF2_0203787 [Komagataeibacter intermedius AF2]
MMRKTPVTDAFRNTVLTIFDRDEATALSLRHLLIIRPMSSSIPMP